MKFINDAFRLRLNGYGASIYQYNNDTNHAHVGKCVLIADRYGATITSKQNKIQFTSLGSLEAYLEKLPGANEASKLNALLVRLGIFDDSDQTEENPLN